MTPVGVSTQEVLEQFFLGFRAYVDAEDNCMGPIGRSLRLLRPRVMVDAPASHPLPPIGGKRLVICHRPKLGTSVPW